LTEDKDKELLDVFRRFVPPTNIEYAHFISNEDSVRLSEGADASFERRFALQVSRDAQHLEQTVDKFKASKLSVKRALADMAGIQKDADKIVDGAFGSLESEYEVDIGFRGMKMSAFPVHVETDRALANSIRSVYTTTDEAGDPVVNTGVATIALVELNGRAIFLYTWGGEDDLDWSREASRQWMEAMLVANPSRQAKSRFYEDWNPRLINATTGALIGLILGGLAGLVGWLAVRLRRKSGE
jgi:hypothetical protein